MLGQKFRTSSEISELSEIQSLQAVKSMLQVSLQEIAWSRSFLPKSMCIGKKKLAGCADVKIHQLHSIDTKPAKMFEAWMQNISDLLKSNRLSSVIFGVHDDINKPDEFSEMFHFHIEDTKLFKNPNDCVMPRIIVHQVMLKHFKSSATSVIRSLETLLGTLPAPSTVGCPRRKFMFSGLFRRIRI